MINFTGDNYPETEIVNNYMLVGVVSAVASLLVAVESR